MSYALEIQSEAVIDIQEAFEWYETKREGLGFDFIEEVENGLENISNNPKYYSFISENFRRYKIKRFPYLVVYEIEGASVVVNSVKHSSRKRKL